MSVKKKCDICGRDFVSSWKNAKYCSRACQGQAALRRSRAFRNAPEPGKMVRATCCRCGREFEYPHVGKARKVCDSCHTTNGRRRPVETAPVEKHAKICLFCGRRFNGAAGEEFCRVCVRERLDTVCRVRKECNPFWISDGDRARAKAAELGKQKERKS